MKIKTPVYSELEDPTRYQWLLHGIQCVAIIIVIHWEGLRDVREIGPSVAPRKLVSGRAPVSQFIYSVQLVD